MANLAAPGAVGNQIITSNDDCCQVEFTATVQQQNCQKQHLEKHLESLQRQPMLNDGIINSNNNNNNNNTNNKITNNKRGVDSLSEQQYTTTTTTTNKTTNSCASDGDGNNRKAIGSCNHRQPLKKYRSNDYATINNNHSGDYVEDNVTRINQLEQLVSPGIGNINSRAISNDLKSNSQKEESIETNSNKLEQQQQSSEKEYSAAVAADAADRSTNIDTDVRNNSDNQLVRLPFSIVKHSSTGASGDDTGAIGVSSADNIALRFLIRRREAGAIIGNGPERVLNITADHKLLDKILKQLSELLHEKSLATDGDDQVELRMLIHSSHAGTIIGKGGNSIKKLRDGSKAAIKIFALCCPLSNERVVAIKAKPPVVVNTIKQVLDIILESSIKGVIKPYDALNFDQNISDKYGGYRYDETDLLPPNGPYVGPPQQLSPPPFSPNPFNHPPSNHFMSTNNYRLHATPPHLSSHQNCPPCRSVFASQTPLPCTTCQHQRAEHCARFVQNRHPYHHHHQINQQCGNRFCSYYHQMPNNGPNNVRNNNMHNGHKFHHIHM